MSARPWLVELERALAAGSADEELATVLVVLASIAGGEVRVDENERHAATRRALLLLTSGGDPGRGLDLHGRAVSALADDLRTVDRQIALEQGIASVRLQAAGLAHVSELVHALMDAPEIAWRAYACALLAEELGAEDE
ncbi:MAG: hypothetical protein M3312_03925 [Actinomycetota bacterium]|nr:hypothetical protein [Actinomycetota bacterium]